MTRAAVLATSFLAAGTVVLIRTGAARTVGASRPAGAPHAIDPRFRNVVDRAPGLQRKGRPMRPRALFTAAALAVAVLVLAPGVPVRASAGQGGFSSEQPAGTPYQHQSNW